MNYPWGLWVNTYLGGGRRYPGGALKALRNVEKALDFKSLKKHKQLNKIKIFTVRWHPETPKSMNKPNGKSSFSKSEGLQMP
jgi:hypothetical protein